MECNVGLTEQKLRVLAGMALIGFGAYYNTKALAALGIIPILTAMIRWCPINEAIGYDGCSKNDKEMEDYT